MESFELYRIATEQYNKAMKYHNAITYNDNKRTKEINTTKQEDFRKIYKERKIQQVEYEKALFYYKLYRAVLKQEEQEDKNK